MLSIFEKVITEVPEYYFLALKAASSASVAIMQSYANEVNVITKSDGSPVTEADLNSSRIIEDILFSYIIYNYIIIR